MDCLLQGNGEIILIVVLIIHQDIKRFLSWFFQSILWLAITKVSKNFFNVYVLVK